MIICQSPNDSNDSQTIHRLSRLYIQLLAHFPAQLKQLLLFRLQRLNVEKRTVPSTNAFKTDRQPIDSHLFYEHNVVPLVPLLTLESIMTIKTFESNEARARWRDMLDLAQTSDTDVIITRYNKPVVAVVAYEDYIAVQEELHKRRAQRVTRQQLEARATMIASERVFAKEWNTPEEDEAWANL